MEKQVSSIAKIIGKRIWQYRNECGISQEELALRADMHASHIGQFERGQKSPSIESIEKIVNALDITFAEFFSFDIAPAVQDDALISKIISYLKAMSKEEQHNTLKVVKILSGWND